MSRLRNLAKSWLNGANDVTLSIPMFDWRIGDDADEQDELTEAQRQVRNVSITQLGSSQLLLQVDNPDGTRHLVGFELDRGNFRILTYANDSDEVDAIISLTSEGTHVAAGSEDQNFLVSAEKDLLRYGGPAPGSFANIPSIKP
ncbi:hypothetical protein [Bradyrhizobium sp. USDA 4350]